MFDFSYYLITDIGFPSFRQVYCSTIQLKISNDSDKEENMFCFGCSVVFFIVNIWNGLDKGLPLL